MSFYLSPSQTQVRVCGDEGPEEAYLGIGNVPLVLLALIKPQKSSVSF